VVVVVEPNLGLLPGENVLPDIMMVEPKVGRS
jgi:hypothetical protein